MKLDVMRPERVLDLDALSQTDLGDIEIADGGLYLGALVRMADAADHEQVRGNYPVISQTLELAASQQIRNMASLGGNVLQRTRCPLLPRHELECLQQAHPRLGLRRPSAGSTACMPCWARVTIALQPIPATSPRP